MRTIRLHHTIYTFFFIVILTSVVLKSIAQNPDQSESAPQKPMLENNQNYECIEEGLLGGLEPPKLPTVNLKSRTERVQEIGERLLIKDASIYDHEAVLSTAKSLKENVKTHKVTCEGFPLGLTLYFLQEHGGYDPQNHIHIQVDDKKLLDILPAKPMPGNIWNGDSISLSLGAMFEYNLNQYDCEYAILPNGDILVKRKSPLKVKKFQGKREFTSKQKLSIVKAHLIEKVKVEQLCKLYNIKPEQYKKWEKQLFDRGASAFVKNTRHDVVVPVIPTEKSIREE